MSSYQSSCLPCVFAVVVAMILASGCATTTRRLGAGQTQAASASLFVPYQFQVQALDGTVIRDSFYTFDGRNQTLAVAPGKHRLVLRYFDLIRGDSRGSDDYARVLSPPIRIAFTAQADGRYAVIGEHPATRAAGTAFAADPSLAVENRDSGATVSGPVTLAPPENKTRQRHDNKDTPAPDAHAAAQATPGAASATAGASDMAGTQDTSATAAADAPPRSYQMLKYWWNNASADVRERFDAWRRRPSAE